MKTTYEPISCECGSLVVTRKVEPINLNIEQHTIYLCEKCYQGNKKKWKEIGTVTWVK